MASLRDIFIRLGVKTDPRGFQKVAKGIGDIKASAVIAVAALAGLAVGFKKIIEAASDIEETANKFGAVFGAAGKEVQTALNQVAKDTGATNLQLQTMASNIGAIIKPALGSAKAAGVMSVGVSKLALDIASFNNVSADEALVALRSGLIGSAEPLQRFGVDTRIAALEQEAMRQGIAESVKEMTEGQRIALRYAAIQRQLGSQGATGDATKTAKDFANASRNLSQAIKETAGIIGTFFLKSVGGLVNRMRDLIDTFQMWLAENRKLIQQGVDKFLTRSSRIISSFVNVMGRVISATKDWANSLGPVGRQLLKIGSIVAGLAILLLLPGAPILLLITLIALIIEDFEVWRNKGDSVIGDILGMFDSLIATVQDYRDAFLGGLDDLSAWVEAHEDGLTVVAALVSGLAIVIGVGLVKANAAALVSWIALKAFTLQYYATVIGLAIAQGAANVAAALASAAAWIAAAAPVILLAILWGIVIGVIILLGIELKKLFEGDATSFFSVMADGISDLIDDFGGIPGAIGEFLTTAIAFWLEFFGVTEGETREFIDTLFAWFSSLIPDAVKGWVSAVGGFFSFLLGKLGSIGRFLGEKLGFEFDTPEEDAAQREERDRQRRQADIGTLREARTAARDPRGAATGFFRDVLGSGPRTGRIPDSLRQNRAQRKKSAPVIGGAAAQLAARTQSQSVASRSGGAPAAAVPNITSNVNVEVRAAPGMDEQKLADLIPKEIKKAQETQLRQAAQSFVVEAPAT